MPQKRQPYTRSEIMSRIKSRNTGPEHSIRKALYALGLRYRIDFQIKDIVKADIAFPGKRVAIFIDGCFWHFCPIHGRIPKTNSDYWKIKFECNAHRDIKQNQALLELGWIALRFWEHMIIEDKDQVIQTIVEELTKNRLN